LRIKANERLKDHIIEVGYKAYITVRSSSPYRLVNMKHPKY
jgi:hypothetical protein